MRKHPTGTSFLHIEVANIHLLSPAFCGWGHLHPAGVSYFFEKKSIDLYFVPLIMPDRYQQPIIRP